jgi:hypothetical protein
LAEFLNQVLATPSPIRIDENEYCDYRTKSCLLIPLQCAEPSNLASPRSASPSFDFARIPAGSSLHLAQTLFSQVMNKTYQSPCKFAVFDTAGTDSAAGRLSSRVHPHSNLVIFGQPNGRGTRLPPTLHGTPSAMQRPNKRLCDRPSVPEARVTITIAPCSELETSLR